VFFMLYVYGSWMLCFSILVRYVANLRVYAGELHQLTIGLTDIGVLCSFIGAWRFGVCGFML
jgi:hypothetical protein